MVKIIDKIEQIEGTKVGCAYGYLGNKKFEVYPIKFFPDGSSDVDCPSVMVEVIAENWPYPLPRVMARKSVVLS